MAKQKPIAISKNVRRLRKFAKQHLAATRFISILAILCLSGSIAVFARFFTAIHDEQRRFNTVHAAIQETKTSLQQVLGSSLTDIKEYDSCYHMDQTETPAPPIFANGVLYCGMNLQGATYPWQRANASNKNWETMVYVNQLVMSSFNRAGLAPVMYGHATNEPEIGRPISFGSSFTLYGNLMYCVVSGDSEYNDFVYPSVEDSLPGQLYFSLNCEQQSTISYYHFVPSGLD